MFGATTEKRQPTHENVQRVNPPDRTISSVPIDRLRGGMGSYLSTETNPQLTATAEQDTGPIAPEDIVAIDFHTHVLRATSGMVGPSAHEESLRALFGFGELPDLRQMAREYRARRMAFVVFDVDDFASTGQEKAVSDREIARIALEFPDVIIPFGSVDPNRGAQAVVEAAELVDEHNIRGFKFHPTQQRFYPSDKEFYPLYEELESRGVPALFHSGVTGVGRGEPGGAGMRLKYSNPIYLDDIAVDFPALKIVIAHPSFPWQDEAIAIAQHKPNVFIDLSGWSPKYFPENLIKQINGPLSGKVLFGSDYPALTPERWMTDFEALSIKDAIRPLVYRRNAEKLLGWPEN
ncbi:amidohydrolase family protein [Rhodoglobus vestalii]|uniref:amidohydrolase family protein n=1 Tax=Rhodoglobus vestalii TaxID=193384 RepID=UPI001C0281AC|nr:amidohydrolase family protein [Rhodoglobus vestalii]